MVAVDDTPVLILSGSPSRDSRTAKLGDHIVERLARRELGAAHIRVRDIPASALLSGDVGDHTLTSAIAAVAAARGVIIATPTYKASFSGLIKAFLDLLPQFGLRDKVAMPVATGGSLAHVLSLDYGLRPVIQSMRPRVIVPSVFVLDKDLATTQGPLALAPDCGRYLDEILAEFEDALRHPQEKRPYGAAATAELSAALS